MSLSVYKPSTLVYPGSRLAGVDPTHPASSKLRMSVVIANNAFSVIPSSVQGTNALAYAVDGFLGPILKLTSNNSNITFAGPAVTEVGITFGIIVSFVSGITAFSPFLDTRSSAGGSSPYWAYNSSTTFILGIHGGTNATHNFPFTTALNTPYFLGLTWLSGGAYTVAQTNLATGQSAIATGTDNQVGTSGSDGKYTIGSNPSFGATPDTQVAAAMVSGAVLTPSQMLAWAADPWAFWYPRTLTDTMFDSMFVPSSGNLQGWPDRITVTITMQLVH